MYDKISPPAKWLIAFIIIVLGLSFLFAPRPHPIVLTEISFTTTSSSRLYFKNVRSYYYNIYPREKPPFTIYRLKRRIRDTNQAYLQFMIIDNQSADEAYIYAESSPVFKQYDSLAVFIPNVKDTTDRLAFLSTMISEDHYLFAGVVFTKLLRGEKVFLMNKSDTLTELFTGKKELRNASTVLEDYFKLVNKN